MNAWRIEIEIPLVDEESRLSLFDEIVSVVDKWQPKDRNWDASLSAHAYQDDLFPQLNNWFE
jgi:hypothetical protein